VVRLPKKYNASGDRFKICKRSTGYSSYVCGDIQEITVDTGAKGDFKQICHLLHEMTEATFDCRGMKFRNWDQEDVFIMSHREFNSAMDEVARGVYDLLVANGVKLST